MHRKQEKIRHIISKKEEEAQSSFEEVSLLLEILSFAKEI